MYKKNVLKWCGAIKQLKSMYKQQKQMLYKEYKYMFTSFIQQNL